MLRYLPDCLRYGIGKEQHAAMIRSGLNDRIALHLLGKYIDDNDIFWFSHSGLRRILRERSSEVIVYLINQSIPHLSLKKVKKWLRV